LYNVSDSPHNNVSDRFESSPLFRRSRLKLLQLNVRSISNKLEELEIFFNVHQPDVICISEHWQASEAIVTYKLENFHLANSFCRSTNIHGGVAIFIKNGIKSKRIPSIDSISTEFDCELAAVELTDYRTVIISAYHSPPPNGSFESFIDKMQVALSECRNMNNIVLAGDFNIDLLQKTTISDIFIDLCECFGIKPLFLIATRLSHSSGTCIDNVFTDLPFDPDKLISLHTGFSDHNAQLCELIACSKLNNQKIKYKILRKFSATNYEKFSSLLIDKNWEQLLNNCNHVNIKFNEFHDFITYIFDISFPLTRSKINTLKENKSWITAGIKVSSQRLKSLRLIKNKNNDTEFLDYFKNYKRIFYKVCRAAKRNCFKSLILKSSSNKTKSTWKFINSYVRPNESDDSIVLEHSDRILTNPIDVANLLNDLFNENTPAPKLDYHPDITKYSASVVQTCYIEPVSEIEMLGILNSFKNKRAVGFDGISCELLLRFKEFLLSPITHIVNESLRQGVFPERLKLGVIKPLCKNLNKSKRDPKNYRPISNLSVFSKILEKSFILKTTSFLRKNKIIIPEQHGFLEGRSTITALFDFINKVYEQIDKSFLTSGMFFDISKAFDTVDHRVLLEKVERWGIRGTSNAWLASYLSNRVQVVETRAVIGSTEQRIVSRSVNSNCGVVQGSVIGPYLFILFASDIPFPDTLDQGVLYADDISEVFSAMDEKCLSDKAQSLVSTLSVWANSSRLQLNIEKSFLMRFRNRMMSDDNLECGLENVQKYKLLGIMLDSKLNWTPQLDSVAKRVASGCHLIKRLRTYCDLATLRAVYCAYIQCSCTYGIIFWGNATGVDRILKLQKWAVRTMLGLKRRDSCREHFKSLKIMTVPALFIFYCYQFIIKYKSKFFPTACSGGYDVRPRCVVKYPPHRTAFFEKCPYYQCARIFNRLPLQLRKLDNEKRQINLLKEILINDPPYSVDELFDSVTG
jgi:hypothetical protein